MTEDSTSPEIPNKKKKKMLLFKLKAITALTLTLVSHTIFSSPFTKCFFVTET